jgi:hypothetical protein
VGWFKQQQQKPRQQQQGHHAVPSIPKATAKLLRKQSEDSPEDSSGDGMQHKDEPAGMHAWGMHNMY